jgi:hypothetical protein
MFSIRSAGLIVLSVSLEFAPAFTSAQPPADVEGKVRFYNIAGPSFDVYSADPSRSEAQWMREHYLRMQTYQGYFDSRLSWYPDAWVYKDSYAIKPDWAIFSEHPEWVLRDADDNHLFIPWGCSNGSCPQYAGDFGNPAFRSNWIDEAERALDLGYKGLWVDDVNLEWRVSDGDGNLTFPTDPRTGQVMTTANWRRYFAEFMEEIRAAFPEIEIAHNSIWYAGPLDDIYIQRQIQAADYYNFERGATDRGLTLGSGQFGFKTFLNYVDFVHTLGTSAVLMDYAKTEVQREFGLAAWLLTNDGTDLFSNSRIEWVAPNNWWHGYDVNLGLAVADRSESGSLIIREFECGIVILNQPGAAMAEYNLGISATDLDGNDVIGVSLTAGSAAILSWPCGESVRPSAPTDVAAASKDRS